MTNLEKAIDAARRDPAGGKILLTLDQATKIVAALDLMERAIDRFPADAIIGDDGRVTVGQVRESIAKC